MLSVCDLTKIYHTADGHEGGIRGATFSVGRGEFYTLLGPSGCGKTTTLRSIAGLEDPDSGSIEINGRVVFDGNTLVAMNDRDIGMVFQSYAVWPHMTVFQNIAFPLTANPHRRYSADDIRKRVRRVLDVVGLAGFENRPAPMLSGGQQQRLALARAVIAEPQLLLFDEPLSNLDAQLRDQMREELRRLQRELAITALYVTHDQAEALALSDKVAVLKDGRIMQIGSPTEIYYQPSSLFVATFIGKVNLLDSISPRTMLANEVVELRTAVGPIRCRIASDMAQGQKIKIATRPEDLSLTLANSGVDHNSANVLRGRVVNRVFLGEINEYHLQLGSGETFVARGRFGPEIATDNEVDASFPPKRALGLADNGAGVQ